MQIKSLPSKTGSMCAWLELASSEQPNYKPSLTSSTMHCTHCCKKADNQYTALSSEGLPILCTLKIVGHQMHRTARSKRWITITLHCTMVKRRWITTIHCIHCQEMVNDQRHCTECTAKRWITNTLRCTHCQEMVDALSRQQTTGSPPLSPWWVTSTLCRRWWSDVRQWLANGPVKMSDKLSRSWTLIQAHCQDMADNSETLLWYTLIFSWSSVCSWKKREQLMQVRICIVQNNDEHELP